MTTRKTWVEMGNGQILPEIHFVAWIAIGGGAETRADFKVPNPPIYHGDPNLFSRLSFESIKERFAGWGIPVDHIIRGECSENGVRDCYVYAPGRKVPFAVIRPAVFAK